MQRTQAMGITAVVVALLGAVVGLVGVLVCTLRRAGTDRLRARDAQQASEERFAKLFESSPLASGLVSLRDRKFLAVNKAFTKLFGWHPDELVGRMTSSLTFYADATLTGSIYSRLERGGSFADYEVTLLTKSGERREVVCSAEYIVLDGEPAALGVFLDATDRKRAEADQRQSADLARESDRRFRELAENIREVFWLATPDLSQILYVSPAYETLLGRRAADLYANARDWLAAIHPADRERVTTQAAQLAVTGNFDEQYRVVRPDGAIRWIRARGFTVRDDEGRALRLAGVAEDMTERLVLEDQLRQTQKMESLGLLAGGVAHDFNNVLTIISSAAGLLGEDLAKDHPSRELVDEIDQAVARASALTRQLLAFSRKQLVEPKVIDVNDAVNETRKMLRRMVGEDIVLTTSLEPELAHVCVDPGYLVQVLMNLAVNARDAMPRGGTLSLATRNVALPAGRGVMLEIADTGSGIPDHVMEHIFEPFFTTKAHGRGTGMGLAVVHGIVQQAGGSIRVHSTVGVGTTFEVYFPAVDAPADARDTVAPALAFGSETILMVDDDDHVRRAAARALRTRGYTVVEATGGDAALERFTAGERFDLLLTDVVMPGLDGRQLAEAARTRCPSLRVLYTSGYTDDAVVRHGVMHGEVELIEKPFRVNALASKVRQVLDADARHAKERTSARV